MHVRAGCELVIEPAVVAPDPEAMPARLRACRHDVVPRARHLGADSRGVVADLKPMDIHAWFEAYLGDAWHTFDATQATSRGGRVVIAHGRDAADVAFLTSDQLLRTVSIQVWTELNAAA